MTLQSKKKETGTGICHVKIRRRVLRILAGVLSLVTSGTLCAQTHYHSNVSLGVKGGVAVSRFFFNPSVPQEMSIGPTMGVTFRYIEESHFGLIAELNYVQRGWKEKFEDAPQFRYERNINYLSLPILAHIYFGRRGKFFFNCGPEFSLFLGESTSANFDFQDVLSVPGFPIRYRRIEQLTLPVTHKLDYGIAAGIGGEFSINRRNAISLEGRFYYGLGNTLPSKRQDTFSGSNQMTITATVSYWFRVK